MKSTLIMMAILITSPAFGQQASPDKIVALHERLSPSLQAFSGCSDEAWQLIIRVEEADILGEKMPVIATNDLIKQLKVIGDCTVLAQNKEADYLKTAIMALEDGDTKTGLQCVAGAGYSSVILNYANMAMRTIHEAALLQEINAMMQKREDLARKYDELAARYNALVQHFDARSTYSPVTLLHCTSSASSTGVTTMDCE